MIRRADNPEADSQQSKKLTDQQMYRKQKNRQDDKKIENQKISIVTRLKQANQRLTTMHTKI